MWEKVFSEALIECIQIIICLIMLMCFLGSIFLSAFMLMSLVEKIEYRKEKKKRDADDEYYAKAFEALQEKKRSIMNRINEAKAKKESLSGFTNISDREEATNDQ